MRTETSTGYIYVFLGLLSVLLAVGIVCIHTPAQIYDTNANYLASPLPSLLATAAWAVIAVAAVLSTPLLVPRIRFRRFWAVTWFAVAIALWVSSSFLVLDIGPVDGRATTISIPVTFTILSIVVLTATGVASAFFALRVPHHATVIAVVLTVLLTGMTVMVTVKHAGSRQPPADPATTSLFRFSTSRNVLVVLLDSVQADVFDDVLKADVRLQDDLDGFRFLPDTVAPASTTYVSMPAIHSGQTYNATQSLEQVYAEQIWRGSFLVSLANAGYETVALDPVQGECPDQAVCTISETVLAGMRYTARQEYLRLLDFSLFRAAPAHAKRLVFNGGAWQARRWAGDPSGDNRAYRSQRVLQTVSEQMNVTGDRPAAKFLHLFNTHPPAELNGSCQPVSPPLDTNRATMVTQTGCAIRALVEFVNDLKAKGIYENSVIVVVSDHGLGFESSYPQSPGPHGWRGLVGRANGLMLYKPFKAHGKLQRIERPAHASQVFGIICAQTGDCHSPTPHEDGGRRVHHDYTWTNDMWNAAHIPNLRTFAITGPVWALTSWLRVNPPLLKLSTPVYFAAGQDVAPILDWGWADLENWGVWTLGFQSTLSFSTDPENRTRPLRLQARLRSTVGPEQPALVTRVEANGTQISTWQFDMQHREGTFEAVLPPEVWSSEGNVTIVLHIDNASGGAPATNQHERLRVGLESLVVRTM